MSDIYPFIKLGACQGNHPAYLHLWVDDNLCRACADYAPALGYDPKLCVLSRTHVLQVFRRHFAIRVIERTFDEGLSKPPEVYDSQGGYAFYVVVHLNFRT